MSKKQELILLFVSMMGFLLSFTSPLQADGGFFVDPYEYLQATAQEAVIVHDGKTETLIIATHYNGDPSEFAWVIPTPSQPQVEKAPEGIFDSLHTLCSRYHILAYMHIGLGGRSPEAGLHFLEIKEVGIYDVVVLAADTPDALSRWLKKEGFPVPSGAEEIFADYVAREWCFVAVKINAERLTDEKAKDIEGGNTPPLKLTFPSNEVVYPLRISSVVSTTFDSFSLGENTKKALEAALREDVGITLFVFSDHKKRLPGFSAQYAGWVPPRIIKGLADNEDGSPWVASKRSMYLTVLHGRMSLDEMKEDLVIEDASDDRPLNSRSLSLWATLTRYIVFMLCVILSPFGVIFFVGLTITHLCNRPGEDVPRAGGRIIQIAGIAGAYVLLHQFHFHWSPEKIRVLQEINVVGAGIFLIVFVVVPLMVYEHLRYRKMLKECPLPPGPPAGKKE